MGLWDSTFGREPGFFGANGLDLVRYLVNIAISS